jgi:hypothetical protein
MDYVSPIDDKIVALNEGRIRRRKKLDDFGDLLRLSVTPRRDVRQLSGFE